MIWEGFGPLEHVLETADDTQNSVCFRRDFQAVWRGEMGLSAKHDVCLNPHLPTSLRMRPFSPTGLIALGRFEEEN